MSLLDALVVYLAAVLLASTGMDINCSDDLVLEQPVLDADFWVKECKQYKSIFLDYNCKNDLLYVSNHFGSNTFTLACDTW